MFTSWYYFQDGVNDLEGPPHTFAKAFCRTLECIGTVAIGALLICFATCLRIILFIFTAEQRIVNGEMNAAQKCLYSVLNCIAWLIEKICQQFTK